MKGYSVVPNTVNSIETTFENRKCGLGLFNSIKTNFNRFTSAQQKVLNALFERPGLQTSLVSSSGRFRIHFDTTGNNAPAYDPSLTPYENALEVGKAADYAYSVEVDDLNYLPPPGDNGVGGDDLLDIYLLKIGPGYYGSTYWEDVIDEAKQTYTSYIEIDPSFVEKSFYTHGLDAMHVTVAHELHHAIQVGGYTNRYDQDGFFYELTSTSMEEFVYDDVNDYYGYIDSYYDYPATPLELTDGYSAATWNVFLQQKFGYDIIKLQWELMPSERALFAINQSLFEHNTSFTKIFNEFGIWMYFTGYRAVPGKYFEEAAEYSMIKPFSVIQFSGSHSPVDVSGKAVSHIYLRYNITSKGDTLFAIISNGDVNSAIATPDKYFDIQYTLFSDSSSGERFLASDYSSTFTNDNSMLWSASEILNDLVVRRDSVINTYLDISDSFIFPNPFNYKTHDGIYISLDAKNGEMVELDVYSVSMNLIYKSEMEISLITQNSSLGIYWNALTSSGERLASGVYIYVIKINDDVIKGKFVVFN